MTAGAGTWYGAFRKAVVRHEFADPLREAALSGRLGDWTRLLTNVVVEACRSLNWVAVAREHIGEVLPVKRQEYLGLDVTAFADDGSGDVPQWRAPVAVFELENRQDQDVVAYSLWKVSIVRCSLRGVFCYQQVPEEVPRLVNDLGQRVMQEVATLPSDWGDVLLVVGTRAKAGAFPDGFFQPWYWDFQWRHFRGLF
jgi:hypothetical protein